MKKQFEEIKQANETIVTTNIKGKDYSEVNQRIKAFRMVYPSGTIETKMISNADGVCIFKAYIYGEPYQYKNQTADNVVVDTMHRGELLATGTAYEKENSTFINKTSYIENCETSAVGRALGMAGFGIDTSVASAEEVQNAMENQKQNTKDKVELWGIMEELELDTDTDHEAILKHYGVKSNADMTIKQLEEAIAILQKKAPKKDGDK